MFDLSIKIDDRLITLPVYVSDNSKCLAEKLISIIVQENRVVGGVPRKYGNNSNN